MFKFMSSLTSSAGGDNASVMESQKQQEGENPQRTDVTNTETQKGDGDIDLSSKDIDLCFACDCTGSMSSYIHTAQQTIKSIATELTQADKNVRFGLVEYRDHPPQDMSFITRVHNFTEDLHQMQTYVDNMSASGGGDGPEAVTAALHDVLNMPWRETATKVVVIIADAPPHGLGNPGDGFPNGDPLGRDPLQIARQLQSKEVVVYCLAVLPSLQSYPTAVDFFVALCGMTGGQAVPLASSHLLPKVVLGATVEEAGLAPLRAEVRDQVIQMREERGRDLTEAEMEEAVASIQRNLRASGRGGRVQHMSHDGALQATHAQTYWDAPTLAVASSSIPMEARGASGSTFVEGRGGSLFSGGVDRGMAPAASRRGSMARGRGGRGSSYAAATACPPSPESTFLPTFGATLFGSAAPAAAPAAGSAPAMEVSVREDEISVEQVRRIAMPYSRRGPSAT